MFKVPAKGESEGEFAARPLYNRSNAFWTAQSVSELVDRLPEDERVAARKRVEEVKAQYGALTDVYQAGKGGADIPLA